MSNPESLRYQHRLFAEAANETDIPGLLALELEAFPPEDAWSEEAFRKELKLRPEGIMVVKDGNRVVGYVHSQAGYDDVLDRQQRNSQDDGVIGSIAVSRQYRGRGIGEYLLRAAIDYLEGQGVARIVASTRANNAEMLGLCEKVGFRRVGTTPDFYGKGQHAIDFELPIN